MSFCLVNFCLLDMNVVDDRKVSNLLARGQSVCLNLFPLMISAEFVH